MNVQFDKKEWFLIGTSTLVVLFLTFGGIWYFYLPVKNQKENLQSEIQTERQLIKALDSKIGSIKQDSFENSSSLQQKVPVKPLTQQLLIDLQKAEIVSDSFITSIEFTEGAVALPVTGETTGTSIEEPVETNAGEPTNSSEPPVNALPQGLQKLTATMSVEAKSYFEIEEFIKKLEELHRIVEVEQISFSGPPEIQQYQDEVENIQLNIVVSAFYLPGLIELEKELPKLDAPLPSNKKNPFQQFPEQKSAAQDTNVRSDE
ncbi:pilus assembly protein PilO [Rossellomorea sp. SC111]|uniref:pilus assembly protein PilO n=1 Tax=Rossellomorea sp. SC111 TaxID=2968985 RepID=UPI00215B72AB|nr:pilus assembly protein PilO [Rossellomorea sp. SC111]MCR8850127.1 pilus assembly protein PilO [Rossellomorea sp. SC111]